MSKSEDIQKWEAIVAKVEDNRVGGRFPIDWDLENAYTKLLEPIFARLTDVERRVVPRPLPPLRQTLITRTNRGQFIECGDHED